MPWEWWETVRLVRERVIRGRREALRRECRFRLLECECGEKRRAEVDFWSLMKLEATGRTPALRLV